MSPSNIQADRSARAAAAVDATDLLRRADRTIAQEYGSSDRFGNAVRHVICCAADMAVLLPAGDLEAAREALGCARAAVVEATYAVRVLHDERKKE
jgi:hypothetical protein